MTIRQGLRVVSRQKWSEVRCKEFTEFSCAKKSATDWFLLCIWSIWFVCLN